MFTFLACISIALFVFWAQRTNNQGREHVARSWDDDLVRQSIVFIRGDVKLIAVILGGILIMLGIIADHLH